MSLLVDNVSYNLKTLAGRTEEDIRKQYEARKAKHVSNLIEALKKGGHLKEEIPEEKPKKRPRKKKSEEGGE